MTDEFRRLGVVVVAYNSDRYLPAFLQSLSAETPYPARTVIVDNSASADTEALVHEATLDHLDVVYISDERNGGYASAVNLGSEAVRDCDLLLVANPDMRFLPGSLKVLCDVVEQHDVLVGPNLVDERGQDAPVSARLPSVWSVVRSLMRLDRGAGPVQASEGVFTPVAWLSGACILVRASTARQVGPWDERFFMYMEDVDWCRRAETLGFRSVVARDARVEHVGGGSSDVGSPRVYVQSRLAKLVYFEKWHRPWSRNFLVLAMVIEAVGKASLGALTGKTKQVAGPVEMLRLVLKRSRFDARTAQWRPSNPAARSELPRGRRRP